MKKFVTSLRVRYEETDQMGVVYYANYLVWFEVARTEYLRNLGISYRDDIEKKGLFLMVIESKCAYKAPARYDDIVDLETSITQVKNTSLSFGYIVKRNDLTLAEGSTLHVFVNKEGKPARIPDALKKLIS